MPCASATTTAKVKIGAIVGFRSIEGLKTWHRASILIALRINQTDKLTQLKRSNGKIIHGFDRQRRLTIDQNMIT
jgi:hypothetical protein